MTSSSAVHHQRIRKQSPNHTVLLNTYRIGLAILGVTVRERLLPMHNVNDDVPTALCFNLVGDTQFPESLSDTPTRNGLLLTAIEISEVFPIVLFCIPTPAREVVKVHQRTLHGGSERAVKLACVMVGDAHCIDEPATVAGCVLPCQVTR
jgi:hypothetical protein